MTQLAPGENGVDGFFQDLLTYENEMLENAIGGMEAHMSNEESGEAYTLVVAVCKDIIARRGEGGGAAAMDEDKEDQESKEEQKEDKPDDGMQTEDGGEEGSQSNENPEDAEQGGHAQGGGALCLEAMSADVITTLMSHADLGTVGRVACVSKQLNGIAGTLLRSPAYLRGLQSVLSMHVIVLEDGRATVPEPVEPAEDPGKYEVSPSACRTCASFASRLR